MHPRILVQRSGLAQQRMLAASEALAHHYGLDDTLLTGLRVQSGDPDVRRMQEREAIADVLEAVASHVCVPVSAETPPAVETEVPAVVKRGRTQ